MVCAAIVVPGVVWAADGSGSGDEAIVVASMPEGAQGPSSSSVTTSTFVLSSMSMSGWKTARGRGDAAMLAPKVTRFEMENDPGSDIGGDPARVAALMAAHPGSRAQLSGVSYRWWKPVGQASVGVGVGTVGYALRPSGSSADGPRELVGAVPTMTLGVRYPTSERSAVFADASGARRFNADGSDAVFTKVGIEFKSAPSRLQMMRGGLGLQLDGGGKMSLRLRGGKVGVYMKSEF